MAKRRVSIKEITKIEGHANLSVELEDDKIRRVMFGVHEGSRYFEAFMKGKNYMYIHEMAGKVCGICTVAHELASIKAVENALEIEVPENVERIREMMLISSHIQSHILHLYFLALPDYVNAESAIEIAERDYELVKKAFRIKEATNYMTALLGGREVQPCTLVPGGFSKRITKDVMERYRKKMKEIYPLLVETAELFSSLEYPHFERKSDYVSLYDGKSIPLYNGKIKTLHMEFEGKEYEKHFEEYVVNYSSAKRSLVGGRDYMVGALARLNINPYLREEAKDIALSYSIKFPSDRVAWINVAQAIENVHYALEAMEIADNVKEYEPMHISPKNIDGEGVSAIEAPRGLLIHHYKFKNGKCAYANIITPTAMNTENIERNLEEYLKDIAEESDEVIKKEAEKIIRAYDPCISCSVHVIRTK